MEEKPKNRRTSVISLLCAYCGDPAVVVYGGNSLCYEHFSAPLSSVKPRWDGKDSNG